MNHSILNTQKIKNRASLRSRLAHNLRTRADAAPNADPDRRHLNIIRGASTIEQTCIALDARLSTVTKTIRKDAVLAVEVFLGASREWFLQGTSDEQERRLTAWFEASTAWAEEEFAGANLISNTLHVDERTHHMHLIVVPIFDGQLTSYHWTGGPEKLSGLQDRYAASVFHLGLIRGEKRRLPRQVEDGLVESDSPVPQYQAHIRQRDFYSLQDKVLKSSKTPSPLPPPLPSRSSSGVVEADAWENYSNEMARFTTEVAELHSASFAARAFQASQIGAEFARRRANRVAREAREAEAVKRRAIRLDQVEADLLSKKDSVDALVTRGRDVCAKLAQDIRRERTELELLGQQKAFLANEVALLQAVFEPESDLPLPEVPT